MSLWMENVLKKKTFPTGNMLTKLFHWYISINDSGICNNFFPTLWNKRIDFVYITIGKSPIE